jgi:hypothetical protein
MKVGSYNSLSKMEGPLTRQFLIIFTKKIKNLIKIGKLLDNP